MKDDEILAQVHTMFNHSEGTMHIYKHSVEQYTSFCKMSLHELLKEAEFEEDSGIRWKKRTLKKRLIAFRHYLLDNYSYNTAKTYLHPLLNVYKFYEIEIHTLPKLSKKQIDTSPIKYNDLPDKEIIREAINIASPRMVAIILFMLSSGCARRETLNLSIKDYIDSLKEYTDKTDIYEIIDELVDNKEVVPTFNIRRQKTGKYYTTFCSNEAVIAINRYLLTRKDKLTPESPLFKIYANYFDKCFTELNDELGLGKVGKYFNRFRSHMLRKFHASNLYNDGMSMETVNDLQGKSKNKTDSSYFMTDPSKLKEKYLAHMDCLCIDTELTYMDIKSKEYIRLENEFDKKTQEVEELNNRMDDVEKLINDSVNEEVKKVLAKYM